MSVSDEIYNDMKNEIMGLRAENKRLKAEDHIQLETIKSLASFIAKLCDKYVPAEDEEIVEQSLQDIYIKIKKRAEELRKGQQ